MKYTLSVFPAILLGWIIPSYCLYMLPDLYSRQAWLYIWQLYPIFIEVSLFSLSNAFPDTTEKDKVQSPNRDLPIIRLYVLIPMFFSAWVWIWIRMATPHSLATVFIPTAIPRTKDDIVSFTHEFLCWDELFSYGAMMIWVGYLLGDLKRAGMVHFNWLFLILCTAASVTLLGPGVTVGLGWLWREQILATRYHKDAVTLESIDSLHRAGWRKDTYHRT